MISPGGTSLFGPNLAREMAGCGLGGATKTVIALAVELAAVRGPGDNGQAPPITWGSHRERPARGAMGTEPLTFASAVRGSSRTPRL